MRRFIALSLSWLVLILGNLPVQARPRAPQEIRLATPPASGQQKTKAVPAGISRAAELASIAAGQNRLHFCSPFSRSLDNLPSPSTLLVIN